MDLQGRTGDPRRVQHAAGVGLQQEHRWQNYSTVFGALYSWLREPGARTDHGPIKQLLRDHIIDNMDVCVGRDLLGGPVERRAKFSVQSLAQETGLHRQTLRKVLVDRGVVSSEDADKSNSVVLVDAQDGLAVAEALLRSVPLLQLQVLMNTTRPVLTNLIQLGLLDPLHHGQSDTSREKCGFDGYAVARLMDRIHELAPEAPEMPADWVTLTQCSKRARMTMQHLLRLVFEGRIAGIGRLSGETGFSAIRIDLDEVRRLKA